MHADSVNHAMDPAGTFVRTGTIVVAADVTASALRVRQRR
jgi:hypothetical protein